MPTNKSKGTPLVVTLALVGIVLLSVAVSAKKTDEHDNNDKGGHAAGMRASLGSMANFSLTSLKPLAYRMNTSAVLLDGFTSLPDVTSLLTFDPPNSRAYIESYGTGQWFLPNGTYTYVSDYGRCLLQVEDGTFQDLIDQYSGLLYSTTISVGGGKARAVPARRHGNGHHDDDNDNNNDHHGNGHRDDGDDDDSHAKTTTLDQYVGLITLTELPNSVVMTVDPKGIIHAMVATGPQDQSQLFGGLYSVAYSLFDHARIGSTSWAVFPLLPAACLNGNALPFKPCLLQPAGCPASASR